MLSQQLFIHHVYFWLHNPDHKEDSAKLLEGLQSLTAIRSIKTTHIGVPAGTSREVIDASYSFSWLAIFDTKEKQDAYQVDPIHLQFVEYYNHLWSKVIVYDSIGVY